MAGGSSVLLNAPGSIVSSPQWSPGLMAGGRRNPTGTDDDPIDLPQWSPGLMAGGSNLDRVIEAYGRIAAMEPRPDGRGKALTLRGLKQRELAAAMEPRPDGRGKHWLIPGNIELRVMPQWSPGLMAGGRNCH